MMYVRRSSANLNIEHCKHTTKNQTHKPFYKKSSIVSVGLKENNLKISLRIVTKMLPLHRINKVL